MDSSVAPRGEGTLQLRGLDISFEVLGKTAGGVPVVLTPGGGGGKGGLRWLAQRLRGTRQCLIWDRPNCGASGMTLGDTLLQPEPDLQADYLHLLLHSLGMAPAILLGKSNGARLCLIMAAKYPEDVAGLVLLNVTNGFKAAKRLSNERYFTALNACATGGMDAVASLPRYRELCVKNPENRLALEGMDPAHFMAQHKCWGDFLARAGAPTEYPVTGLHADFLKRVRQPALCVYVMDDGGKDDGMHTVDAIRALHASLPGAVGSEPVVAAESAKETWIAAIESFAASIPCSLAPPQSPSFASQQAPLKPLPGAYPHMPNDAEVKQFETYYLGVATENAAEVERERNAACACNGMRAWMPSGWRASK